METKKAAQRGGRDALEALATFGVEPVVICAGRDQYGLGAKSDQAAIDMQADAIFARWVVA
jgi:hypothetical protein